MALTPRNDSDRQQQGQLSQCVEVPHPTSPGTTASATHLLTNCGMLGKKLL